MQKFTIFKEVPMKCKMIASSFFLFNALAAQAEIALVQVPIACGAFEDINKLLKIKMPKPMAIASGSDSQGDKIVVLVTGTEHWALVTKFTEDRLCIVASGRNWTATEQPMAKTF